MNIRLIILWAVAFCWLASCSRDDKAPHGIINIQEMSGILLDMQIADAYNDNYVPHTSGEPKDRGERIKTFYLQILELHHTDKETFLKSFHFYEERPDLIKKLYDIMERDIARKSAYADSVTQRKERLRTPRSRRNAAPGQVKNFLFPFQSFTDSLHPKPLRMYRPDDYEEEQVPPRVKNFLLLYQTIADSIHHKSRRVFHPDLFY